MKNVVQDLTSGGIDWQREKWQSGLGSKFIHQGEKNAAKYADEVIVLSKGVQKYFLETYGRETHFIPNGVNRPEVGLYKNANCIFTNTYHGMLFCIIFKKQFLFFVQKGSGAAENDRFYSLMSMLHLEDRMVTSGDTACISEKMKRPIDYEKVYSVIRSERLRTDAFFEKYGM